MAADNKCEGFLSGTTNMQSKEDEWLSPYNVTLDIDDSFAIVVKPKCVVSLFEETKVKNEKTTKRKDTQITKKLGTHCCGTYHNNDIKFLDHYIKCHRSQGNSTDIQTSHKHTSTHNTQPKSLNRNNNTTNTTSQPNINNHFPQEDPTTSNTNTSIIGLHTGTSIPLLSCGDIEANPGPIYKCEHQTCGGNEQTFPSIQDLAIYLVPMCSTSYVDGEIVSGELLTLLIEIWNLIFLNTYTRLLFSNHLIPGVRHCLPVILMSIPQIYGFARLP
ncbi:uncharacterized protein [Argopecten irradians]|uniref:uncharacterized protein n=1 Tax=Argopecten irradians TaxID=31199 RepID=UPI003722920C